jgi:hypothetical protein
MCVRSTTTKFNQKQPYIYMQREIVNPEVWNQAIKTAITAQT